MDAVNNCSRPTLSPPSLQSIANLVCVHSVTKLYEDGKDTQRNHLIHIISLDNYGETSLDVLNRIVEYYPEKLTDSLLLAIIPENSKILKVPKCTELTGCNILKVFQKCSFIQVLDLSQCDMLMLPVLFDNGLLPSLTTVYLDECRTVTDDIIQTLLKSCQCLQHISISKCNGITDEAFLINTTAQDENLLCTSTKKEYVFKETGIGLKSINIAFCTNLTSLAVGFICALVGPNLQSIDLSYTDISPVCLLYLAGYSVCDTLHHLDVKNILYMSDISKIHRYVQQLKQKYNQDCDYPDDNTPLCDCLNEIKDKLLHKEFTDGTEADYSVCSKHVKQCSDQNNSTSQNCDSVCCNSPECVNTDNSGTCSNSKTVCDISDICLDCVDVSEPQSSNPATSNEHIAISETLQNNPKTVQLECKQTALSDGCSAPGDNSTPLTNPKSQESTSQTLSKKCSDSKDSLRCLKHENTLYETCTDTGNMGGDSPPVMICNLKSEESKDQELSKEHSDSNDSLHCPKHENTDYETCTDPDNTEGNHSPPLPTGNLKSPESEGQHLSKEHSDSNDSLHCPKHENTDYETCTDPDNRACEVCQKIINCVKDKIDRSVSKFLNSYHPYFHPVLKHLDINCTGQVDLDLEVDTCNIFAIFFMKVTTLTTFSSNFTCLLGHLLDLMTQTQTSLRELSLLGDSAVDEDIIKLCQFPLKLCKIDLKGLFQLTDASVTKIIHNELQALYLSEASISDLSLEVISQEAAHKLKTLDLSWCEELTETGIDMITSSCKALQSLNLRHCPVTSQSLIRLANTSLYIQKLSLSCIEGLEDEAVVEVARNLQLLEEIDISWNSAITDKSISALFQYSHKLKVGIFTGNKRLTSQPMYCLIAGLREWEFQENRKKEESNKSAQTVNHTDAITIPQRSTVYGPNLKTLDLHYVDDMNDKLLAWIVTFSFGSLQIIDYYGEIV